MAYGAENMEIVPHGSSNHGFDPATFQSQVRRSIDRATGAPKLHSLDTNYNKTTVDDVPGSFNSKPDGHVYIVDLCRTLNGQ